MGLKAFVQKLKTEVNIVDLISSYIELQKSGRNFKALCPFHQEKTPSFYVYENTQSYHCFGCGANGDIFAFVQAYENLDFVDSVKLVAERFSIPIPSFESASNSAFKSFAEDMKAIETLFSKNLQEGTPGWHYLKKIRKIDPAKIKEIGLGWSDYSDTSKLLDAFSAQRLKELGILNEKDRNSFSNRLVFSLRDPSGNVLGFSGRKIDHSEQPKYINSPQTEYFNKGKILYLFDQTKKSIKDVDFVIITEGYLDAIRLFINGMKNTVAIMGTSLTKEQIEDLSKYTNKFVFALDSDEAGVKAVEKSFKNLDDTINALVLDLSPAKDPDEYLLKYGIENFQKILLKAISIEEFLLNHIKKDYNLEKETGRDSLITNSQYLLARAKRTGNISRFDQLISRISEWTQLDKRLLLENWNMSKKGHSSKRSHSQEQHIVPNQSTFETLEPEQELTVLYLFHPTTRTTIEAIFTTYKESIKDAYAQFFEDVRTKFKPDDAAEYLKDYFTQDRIESFFRQFQRYEKSDSFPSIIADCERALKRRQLRYEVEKIDILIQMTTDDTEKYRLITNRLKLSKDMNQLKINEGRTLNEREQTRRQ
ncbi:MAG TPA: DNA primase [Thermotogota bacterium]|nr:DNA primase [Thermotogota bacterium]HRW33867.1 DNA primase [Thermotogota bacterium]